MDWPGWVPELSWLFPEIFEHIRKESVPLAVEFIRDETQELLTARFAARGSRSAARRSDCGEKHTSCSLSVQSLNNTGYFSILLIYFNFALT